jgi:hypothetical protein
LAIFLNKKCFTQPILLNVFLKEANSGPTRFMKYQETILKEQFKMLKKRTIYAEKKSVFLIFHFNIKILLTYSSQKPEVFRK